MYRLSAALTAALALSASACGAEAVPEDVGQPTKALLTARIETHTRFEFAGQRHEVASIQVVDYVNDRSERVDAGTGCRTIVIGDVSYAEMPSDAGLPQGKRWVRFSPSTQTSEEIFEASLEEPTPSDSGWTSYVGIHLFVADQTTPTEYFDHLQEIADEVHAMGEEDVRGVTTTRYRVLVDVTRETRHDLEADGWRRANIDRYLDQVPATREERDVWVDADGRVRKIVTIQAPGQGLGLTTMTIEYSDFDGDVEIGPPPPETVLDETEWRDVAPQGSLRVEGSVYEVDDGSSELPGSFAPTETVAPPRCLH